MSEFREQIAALTEKWLAENGFASLDDALRDPEASVPEIIDAMPERRARVSKLLAQGAGRGRWVVIYDGRQEPGYHVKQKAEQIAKARRQMRARNVWMLNLDRIDQSMFDALGARLYVATWLAKNLRYSVVYVSRETGVPYVDGPMSLFDALFKYVVYKTDRAYTNVTVFDAVSIEQVYPALRRPRARPNPPGIAFSGATTVNTREGRKQAVMVRPVVRGPDGKKHRPRVYLPAAEAIAVATSQGSVADAVSARRRGESSGRELVPRRRKR